MSLVSCPLSPLLMKDRDQSSSAPGSMTNPLSSAALSSHLSHVSVRTLTEALSSQLSSSISKSKLKILSTHLTIFLHLPSIGTSTALTVIMITSDPSIVKPLETIAVPVLGQLLCLRSYKILCHHHDDGANAKTGPTPWPTRDHPE